MNQCNYESIRPTLNTIILEIWCSVFVFGAHAASILAHHPTPVGHTVSFSRRQLLLSTTKSSMFSSSTIWCNMYVQTKKNCMNVQLIFYMWLYLVNCKGYNFFCGSNNNKSSSFFIKIKHFCHFFVVMWLIVLRSTIKAYYDYVRIKIVLLALLKNMKVLVR